VKRENVRLGSIKNWANDDRPSEKMLTKGPSALSDSELIAILIHNGNKENSAVELAKEVLHLGHDNLNEIGKLSVTDFQKVKGIGAAKAVTIAAALELGRRRHSGELLEKQLVSNSSEIARYLQTILKDHRHEVFGVVFLNRANKIKSYEIISHGGITGTVADPRIILRKALEKEATGIIVFHNHPSGNLKPSGADKQLTEKIKQGASFLDISLLDHIIVSDEGYFSFADEGYL